MAYMCVLAHSRECDGCMECEDNKRNYDDRWDHDYDYHKEDLYSRREEHDSRYED